MDIEKTDLEGVIIITPKVFGDNRGWFTETFNERKLGENGVAYNFIQDNHSFSAEKGTLRGLHFQNPPFAQTKLVRCTKGSILDVAVDIRKGSPTYLKHVAVELSEENKKQLLIPRGFAHGFLTLTDNVEVQYKVDNIYSHEHDRSIRFDDPDIGIEWNIDNPILSDKDRKAPNLKDSDCGFATRILVTGAKGQLGIDVIDKLKKEGIIAKGIDKDDLDITDSISVDNFIKDYRPQIVIHCAAYTAVDKAETEKEECIAVNEQGTRNLAVSAAKFDAKFIYISTDYVYDGQGIKPHTEETKTSPLSIYGLSKLKGEEALRAVTDKYFILRTSWVFGCNGNNFVKTMLRLAKEKKSFNVVNDQIGSPTYTKDLAESIFKMIWSDKYGIYNVSNEGYCSWFDFAIEIMEQTGIKDVVINPVSSSEYKTSAVRPLNSRLSKNKLEQNGFGRLPYWGESLKKMLGELQK